MKQEEKFKDDERIRKALIAFFNRFPYDSIEAAGTNAKEAIAWLEKQGEHANFRNKIQIGDKVTRNEDGVLVNLSQLNRVAKKQGEQKDILEDAILDSNEDGLIAETIGVKQSEQKPAWSEEDEKYLNATITYLRDAYSKDKVDFRDTAKNCVNWLKSLKERVQPQPRQEWSEEDENRFNNLIFLVECSNEGEATKQGFIKFINRLKSIRPQNTWKPSDEQMKALYEETQKSDRIRDSRIVSIYNDLKKLKEK